MRNTKRFFFFKSLFPLKFWPMSSNLFLIFTHAEKDEIPTGPQVYIVSCAFVFKKR